VKKGDRMQASLAGRHETMVLRHDLSARQVDLLLTGGVINWLRGGRKTH